MDFIEGLKIFVLAMTPIGELRIAIPIGLTVYQMNPISVYFFAVLGNISAVFLILVFLGAFSRWTSKKIYFFNRFFSWLFSQTRKNHCDRVNKYGLYLLPIFVAIPLPITGGWTASLIAFVFGMPFRKAFPLICLGVVAAGVIVSFLSQAGITIGKNFGGQVLVGVLLISVFIYWLHRRLNKNRNNSDNN